MKSFRPSGAVVRSKSRVPSLDDSLDKGILLNLANKEIVSSSMRNRQLRVAAGLSGRGQDFFIPIFMGLFVAGGLVGVDES
jgi:stringent starvation protein B